MGTKKQNFIEKYLDTKQKKIQRSENLWKLRKKILLINT